MDSKTKKQFVSNLSQSLQTLCNSVLQFDYGIQVIGHLYLNIDGIKTDDYIVNEDICRDSKDSPTVTTTSNSFHAKQDEPLHNDTTPPSSSTDELGGLHMEIEIENRQEVETNTNAELVNDEVVNSSIAVEENRIQQSYNDELNDEEENTNNDNDDSQTLIEKNTANLSSQPEDISNHYRCDSLRVQVYENPSYLIPKEEPLSDCDQEEYHDQPQDTEFSYMAPGYNPELIQSVNGIGHQSFGLWNDYSNVRGRPNPTEIHNTAITSSQGVDTAVKNGLKTGKKKKYQSKKERRYLANKASKAFCPVCKKVLCNTTYLKIHMKIHTDSLPAEVKSDTDYPAPSEVLGFSGKPEKISKPTPGNRQKNLISFPKVVKKADEKTPNTNGQLKMKIKFRTDKSKSKRKYPEGRTKKNPPPVGDYTITGNGKGGKSFTCNVCRRGCVTFTNWQIHYRLHTGEKPYKCGDCLRQFASKSNMKAHPCKG